MIDRWTPLRFVFVGVLLFTPFWRWFYTARLPWLYLVVLACALAFFATPLVREGARWWGVLDVPSARKVHMTATPLLGGTAVGGAIVVAVGLLDDVTDLPAWLKLGGQIAAALAAIGYGVILNTVPNWIPGFLWLNVLLTVLWFLTVTNAIQFLDGMDGLAAGLGVIAGIFFSIVSLQTGQRYLMFLSAALVGACLGFLPYNFRPGGATIFLGDSGASFIGFTLAGLAAMGVWADNNPVASLFTPTLILGVPLFDIAFVGIVRVVTGKVHLHHRFAALGLTKTQSVLLVFFVASTLGLSAILLKDATPYETALVLIQAGCILALVAVLEGVGRGRPRG